jgi:hypothetical protein
MEARALSPRHKAAAGGGAAFEPPSATATPTIADHHALPVMPAPRRGQRPRLSAPAMRQLRIVHP